MESKKVFIYANDTEMSAKIEKLLRKKLVKSGLRVYEQLEADTALIICIGGDGTLLRCLRSCDFPTIPVVGINTGHLGFFQELSPDDLDHFISDYENGQYTIQHLSTVAAEVTTKDGRTNRHIGLNEIVIKGRQSYAVHLHICIDGVSIEKFSGDGILVATSAGSTAYNYSLGGSIVDPRLKLLQVTPIAPMNTTAYRSFTSSILLPSDLTIGIVPEEEENKIFIMNDGIETGYSQVSGISITASDKTVQLLRFKDYDFWDKIKTKFL